MRLKTQLYLLGALLMFLCVISETTYSFPKNPVRFSKVNAGILLQRYSFNSFHAQNISSGISYLFGFHQEFVIDKMKQKNFLSLGVEYLHHSFSFQSYYFTQDTLRLYNGKMDYVYYVRMNEICFPLLYKHNFSRENNDVRGVFFSVGYVYRIAVPGFLSVSYQGKGISDQKIRPQFRVSVLDKYANSYVHFSIGYQNNNPDGKMKMYAEIFARYGFSPFLIKKEYTPSNLYFGNYFVGVSVGIKWRR